MRGVVCVASQDRGDIIMSDGMSMNALDMQIAETMRAAEAMIRCLMARTAP